MDSDSDRLCCYNLIECEYMMINENLKKHKRKIGLLVISLLLIYMVPIMNNSSYSYAKSPKNMHHSSTPSDNNYRINSILKCFGCPIMVSESIMSIFNWMFNGDNKMTSDDDMNGNEIGKDDEMQCKSDPNDRQIQTVENMIYRVFPEFQNKIKLSRQIKCPVENMKCFEVIKYGQK